MSHTTTLIPARERQSLTRAPFPSVAAMLTEFARHLEVATRDLDAKITHKGDHLALETCDAVRVDRCCNYGGCPCGREEAVTIEAKAVVLHVGDEVQLTLEVDEAVAGAEEVADELRAAWCHALEASGADEGCGFSGWEEFYALVEAV